MKNLVEVATNKVISEMVDAAVREALKLQAQANKEYAKQKQLEEAGENYNYSKKHAFEEGVRSLCEVLWKMFGGCTADGIAAIRKIESENKSDILGYDCQDYVELFTEAFRA